MWLKRFWVANLLPKIYLFYRKLVKRQGWWDDMIGLLEENIKAHPAGGIGSAIFIHDTKLDDEAIEHGLEEQARAAAIEGDNKIRALVPLGLIPLPEEENYEKHKENIIAALQGSQALMGWKEALVVQDSYFITQDNTAEWDLTSKGVPLEILNEKRSALILNRLVTRRHTIDNYFGYVEYTTDGNTVKFKKPVWNKDSPPDKICFITPKKRVVNSILPPGAKEHDRQD